MLEIPEFITPEIEPTRGRELIALSELDVSRDIMEFIFVQRSDVEDEDLTFYLEL